MLEFYTEATIMTTKKVATTYEGLLENLKKPLEELKALIYNEAKYSQDVEDWADWLNDVKDSLKKVTDVVSQDWAVQDMATDYSLRIMIVRSALMELRRQGKSGWKILREPKNIEKAIGIFSNSKYIGLYPLGYGSVGLMDYLHTGNTQKILDPELKRAVQGSIKRVVDDMRDLAGGELIIDRRPEESIDEEEEPE